MYILFTAQVFMISPCPSPSCRQLPGNPIATSSFSLVAFVMLVALSGFLRTIAAQISPYQVTFSNSKFEPIEAGRAFGGRTQRPGVSGTYSSSALPSRPCSELSHRKPQHFYSPKGIITKLRELSVCATEKNLTVVSH